MSDDPSRLDGDQRRRAWARLAARTYDVVVVGGGVTGAGAALDAASRGLSVALVEAADFAHGTSSRSGKIFHGGLRYLEQLNIGLVREALVERDLMVARLCPHLARPEKFLFPFTSRWERPYVGAGVALYDLLRLTGPRSVPGHRHLSRRGVLRELPGLAPDRVRGGVQYFDVRVDDARHTMTVARTAASYGADVVTRAPVVDVLRDRGAVAGVRVRDADGDAVVDVRAHAVVNATGVWAAELLRLAGGPAVAVTPAKGVHLVVPGDRIEGSSGLIARTPDSVFVVRRWFGQWLMGTTDTRWEGGLDDPVASADDVDYLLGQANRWLRRPLGRDDVAGVYAGLRPLVSGPSGVASTAALSRDHVVVPGPDGLVTVVGGKYTTYRVMARDAVDAAVRELGRRRPYLRVPPSATDTLPLVGAVGWAGDVTAETVRLAGASGLPVDAVRHLLGRYGTRTVEVLDLVADDRSLGRPLRRAPGYLRAEAVYAATHEGARHLDDILARRTRLAMEVPDAGLGAAGEVADLVGDRLGWDSERRTAEREAYLARVRRERSAVAAAGVGGVVDD